jgi:hypothetical protein
MRAPSHRRCGCRDEDDTTSTARGQRAHQCTPPEPRHQAATRCGKHARATLPTDFRKSKAILRSWSLWSQKENDSIRMEETDVPWATCCLLCYHKATRAGFWPSASPPQAPDLRGASMNLSRPANPRLSLREHSGPSPAPCALPDPPDSPATSERFAARGFPGAFGKCRRVWRGVT